MIDRVMSLVVAVSLALLVWLYARSRDQEVLDNVVIPVEVSVAHGLADHYSLEMVGPAQVTVSFTGPPTRVRELQGMIQRKELQVTKTINVPADKLNEPRYSDALVVDPADVNAPGVRTILSDGKSRIPFTLHRLIEKPLQVRFDCIQEGAPNVVIDPPIVRVRGPREVLDRATSIRTQPTELPSRPTNSSAGYGAIARVPLVAELEGRPIRVTPGVVSIRVPNKRYLLADVPVQFLCPAGFHLKPKFIDEKAGKVSLEVDGPSQVAPPVAQVYIDLTRAKFSSGLNHEPLQIQLPKDFALAQPDRKVVAFELLPGDFVPDLGMPVPTGR